MFRSLIPLEWNLCFKTAERRSWQLISIVVHYLLFSTRHRTLVTETWLSISKPLPLVGRYLQCAGFRWWTCWKYRGGQSRWPQAGAFPMVGGGGNATDSYASLTTAFCRPPTAPTDPFKMCTGETKHSHCARATAAGSSSHPSRYVKRSPNKWRWSCEDCQQQAVLVLIASLFQELLLFTMPQHYNTQYSTRVDTSAWRKFVIQFNIALFLKCVPLKNFWGALGHRHMLSSSFHLHFNVFVVKGKGMVNTLFQLKISPSIQEQGSLTEASVTAEWNFS